MAASPLSAPLNLMVHGDSRGSMDSRSSRMCRLHALDFGRNFTSSMRGSPVPVVMRTSSHKTSKQRSLSVRCEQSSEAGNSLDVWLGRFAMVGFAAAISVEIATGKGLLENFGVASPLPTAALGVTALVGILTAVFIFQSASKN